MFTDQQKVDIRRFCFYPVYGGIPSSFQSYRYFQAYGLLEYRMGQTGSTDNMLPEEQAAVLSKLQNLYALEAAIITASSNLDTDKAAVWTHNKNEVRDRVALFDYWRIDLCDFIGVPRGPQYGSRGSGNSIALVV